ncbi:predicted protein [Aspergillus terreus NIH2624]|uniref:Uncharacterized protein n=1 Tax=Aspergillus terreus (strain NIH 2624 / FGSC A1156) TaxID=341663 RepID=Q0CBJ9_ASPTN|nr:uncharacterized protein ATEG_08935 [Aspergillus terreus NIH2624]EAU31067.1 predicted protein [Aspergillus terreus NIH2624]
MSREEIIRSSDPRTDALNYVTKNGRYTLQVEEFIEAGRPDGTELHSSYVTRHTTPNGQAAYAPAIKGVSGHIVETGQSFTVRDDYDFNNPSGDGKGYHVNAQLGKATVAFVSGQNSAQAYYDRTNMTGERLYFDGKQSAASWYTQGHSR